MLYEGREIFFGPVDMAADYFTALGFTRPSRATTPDFLTSLTNPAERIIREGWETRVPQSPDEFSIAWKQSDMAQSLRANIKVFDSAYPLDNNQSTKKKLDVVGK